MNSYTICVKLKHHCTRVLPRQCSSLFKTTLQLPDDGIGVFAKFPYYKHHFISVKSYGTKRNLSLHTIINPLWNNLAIAKFNSETAIIRIYNNLNHKRGFSNLDKHRQRAGPSFCHSNIRMWIKKEKKMRRLLEIDWEFREKPSGGVGGRGGGGSKTERGRLRATCT